MSTRTCSASAEGQATAATGSRPDGGDTQSEKGTPTRGACHDGGASCEQPVVLVVEDDARLRHVIVTVLGMRGFAVLAASNGPSAVDLMKEAGRIDLLLADLVMPRMSGAELGQVAERMRPGISVVLMTGGLCDDPSVLHKPFTMDLLVRALRARLAEQLGRPTESP